MNRPRSAEAEKKSIFFMRARTRSMTRWGLISILAALCVLGISVTNDPQPVAPQLSEAVFREDDVQKVPNYPSLSSYTGAGRNVFVFSEPPKPKLPATAVVKAPPKPVIVVQPKPKPEKATFSTNGLELLGVAAGRNGGGWAIIGGADRNDLVVKCNDKVRDMKVGAIYGDRIVLEKDGMTKELKLRSSYDKFIAAAQAQPTGKEKRAQPAVVRKEQPARRKSIGFSVRPSAKDNGLVVTKLRRFDIDVRTGDIVKSIDGVQVFTLSAARDAIDGASEKESIAVGLLRKGQPLSVSISMTE
ncbi:MAG: hypothetical protein JXR97_14660 [Planctomycetes bacterium]|nr:hypothetical protein [Planctomycetota bacterium]